MSAANSRFWARVLTERQIDFFSTFFPAGLYLRDRRHHLGSHGQGDQRLVHRLSLYAADA
ncbi:MAG: hypothetical protein MZV64_19655 [Ignavibacteriales bacterium]|nr:hypothetical protein [Ignavibacteriales bacterium]